MLRYELPYLEMFSFLKKLLFNKWYFNPIQFAINLKLLLKIDIQNKNQKAKMHFLNDGKESCLTE